MDPTGPTGPGRLRRAVRGRDIGLAYCLLVTVGVVVVFTQSERTSVEWVLQSSTNLVNLHNAPMAVLVVSAFVLSSPHGLWLLPFVVWAFGSAQRWVGRTSVVIVAAFGHIFATVFVAVLLTAGIAHHQLSRNLAHEPDVGVSYALAAVVGLLVFRLSARHRRLIALAEAAGLVTTVVLSQTFTDLGHLVAWVIGLGIGFVASRPAVPAAVASDTFRSPKRHVEAAER